MWLQSKLTSLSCDFTNLLTCLILFSPFNLNRFISLLKKTVSKYTWLTQNNLFYGFMFKIILFSEKCTSFSKNKWCSVFIRLYLYIWTPVSSTVSSPITPFIPMWSCDIIRNMYFSLCSWFLRQDHLLTLKFPEWKGKWWGWEECSLFSQ